MNLPRVAKALGALAALSVLIISGLYVLVYLQRWEWNRALVSGLLFLSTLMLGSTVLVLRRLAALAGTVRENQDRGLTVSGDADPTVTDALRRSSADAARRHFEWLRPDDGRLGVFVPILLGTGAILSAVAYVIERVAGLVAGATLDRRTAAVVPLHLPLGNGPVAVTVGTAGPTSGGASGGRRPHRLRTAVAIVTLVVVAAAGIEGLRRITQSESSGVTLPGRTTMVVEVRTKRDETAAAAFAALWAECARRVEGAPRVVDAVEAPLATSGAVVAASRFTIEIDTAFTAIGRQRIIGCLSDLTADLVAATVDPASVTEELSTGTSPQDLPSLRHAAAASGGGV